LSKGAIAWLAKTAANAHFFPMSRLPFCLTALLALATQAAPAAEYVASNPTEATKALGSLKPGDELILADGEWPSYVIAFKAKGTAEKPITLRAQTPGKAILTGKSSVLVSGTHLIVNGLLLKNTTGTGEGILLSGSHNRLSETAIIGGKYKYFVHLRGSEHRVDHCYLEGKTSEGPTLQIEAEGTPNHHRVDHNHFGPRRRLGQNGGETIRIGYSFQSLTNSSTLVEHNLFDRCNGELEIISNKSSDNIYRANTFLECEGMLTLRHGNRCLIDGNFFLGNRKKSTGGIRVIGEDHVVINNYFEGLEKGLIWITAGVPNSKLEEYFQAQRCLIAFNTIVNCRGPALELDAGFGDSKRSLRPADITLANNLFSMRPNDAVFTGTEGERFQWLGNAVLSPGTKVPAKGFTTSATALTKDAEGLFRPSAPIVAEGNFLNVNTDLDGQPRTAPLHAGCDQTSTAPVTARPMTAKTTGPAWLPRTAGEPKKSK
jgi:poly(beta-D-mannuronate) lyase